MFGMVDRAPSGGKACRVIAHKGRGQGVMRRSGPSPATATAPNHESMPSRWRCGWWLIEIALGECAHHQEEQQPGLQHKPCVLLAIWLDKMAHSVVSWHDETRAAVRSRPE